MEQDTSLIPSNYINSPFAYARLLNKYNRTQLHLLLRVTERIQKYIKKFYNSDLKNSTSRPQPLFSEEDKRNMERMVVSFSELGITTNNIPNVQEKINEALELILRRPIIRKNGVLDFDATPAFTHIQSDRENHRILFDINMKIADELFDMSYGYISHPDDIALLANVEKMPSLYFYLRHLMLNWKKKTVKVGVFELKDALGLVERNDKNEIININYPRFSKLKQRVIDPALKDLDRLKGLGQIDKSFNVEYDYGTKGKRGDPDWIIFSIKEEEVPKEPEPTQTELQFSDDSDTTNSEIPKSGKKWWEPAVEQLKQENEDRWKSFVMHYEGRAKEVFEQTKFYDYTKGKDSIAYIEYSDEVQKEFSKLKITPEEKEDILRQISLHFPAHIKDLRRYQPKRL